MKRVSAGFLIPLLVSAVFMGCAGMQTNQEKGTAAGAGGGAAVGAALGQVIGGDTESTLLGAGIGAAVGGLAGNQIGKYMDRQEQDLRNAVAATESASVRRDQDILRATFEGETFFDYDSSQLKPGGIEEIRRISGILQKYPQTTIEVAGHTDTLGPAEYNQRLSEQRALAVREALVQNGVAPRRRSAAIISHHQCPPGASGWFDGVPDRRKDGRVTNTLDVCHQMVI